MALLDLPTELILLILGPLSESDLAHLLQVHRSLYNIVLPRLYQRHLQDDTNGQEKGKGLGLFRCTVTGNVAAVRHFLHYGADVNAFISAASIHRANIPPSFLPWHNVQTPLNIAANMGNDALVSLLLSHGASINGFPSHGVRRTVQPAVVDALLSGHESTVRLLLKHGSPMHDPGMERGGLINCAIARGQLSLLKLLVNDFGADVNITWQEGEVYPLNRAVSSSGERAAEIVQFLLDNGADIGLANGSGGGGGGGDDDNTGGQRLFHQAIRHGTIDTLRLMLDRGVVKAAARALSDNDIFRTWIIRRCTVEAVRVLLEHGYYALEDIHDTLMTVVRLGRGDILQLFIDSGVNLNTKPARAGSTLLHAAVVRCRGSGSDLPVRVTQRAIECARAHERRPKSPVSDLRARNIEPDLHSQQQVSTRRCMSDRVEKCAPEDIVRCLIRGGADVNALNARGLSPLALAEKGPLIVRQMLVDCGGK